VLSQLYGCRCHGIELTQFRYEDAVLLTELVGLSDLVTFSCGDFLSLQISDGPYDVVIGQAAFIHFSEPKTALRKCQELLTPVGHLIVEDGYLCHRPSGSKEHQQTEAAWDHWNGRFRTLDDWQKSLSEVGFEVLTCEDQTTVALNEYEQQFRTARQHQVSVASEEIEGWRLGDSLIRSGVIGMVRLIAAPAARPGEQ
jgi:ubiquinone/menaquinone biosynthesis C-methylase UbiE